MILRLILAAMREFNGADRNGKQAGQRFVVACLVLAAVLILFGLVLPAGARQFLHLFRFVLRL